MKPRQHTQRRRFTDIERHQLHRLIDAVPRGAIPSHPSLFSLLDYWHSLRRSPLCTACPPFDHAMTFDSATADQVREGLATLRRIADCDDFQPDYDEKEESSS